MRRTRAGGSGGNWTWRCARRRCCAGFVRLWVGTQLALTLDATSLGDRFVVLVVSVVYRGIGIPVAWTVQPANAKGAWRDEFWRLLCRLQPAVPAEWTVIVLADRGLSSSGLYQQIKRLQWHPFLRINSTAKFQPGGKQHHWYWLLDLLHPAGRKPRQQWQGRGRCFKEKGSSIDCTLLAWWGEQYEEPWFILTDLAPAACAATWYGLRSWCEQGFKCNKRGAWQWQHTRMHHPQPGRPPLAGPRRRHLLDGRRRQRPRVWYVPPGA